MFSENVILKDWSIEANGKKEVLQVLEGIFNSTNTIRIEPISFFSNSEYSYAVSISIYLNETLELRVIDVIKFDFSGKIQEIYAFKS